MPVDGPRPGSPNSPTGNSIPSGKRYPQYYNISRICSLQYPTMPGARFTRLVFFLSTGIRIHYVSDRPLRLTDSMETIVLPHHFHTPVDLALKTGERADPPPVTKTNVENTQEFFLSHYFDTEDFNRRLHSLENPAREIKCFLPSISNSRDTCQRMSQDRFS